MRRTVYHAIMRYQVMAGKLEGIPEEDERQGERDRARFGAEYLSRDEQGQVLWHPLKRIRFLAEVGGIPLHEAREAVIEDALETGVRMQEPQISPEEQAREALRIFGNIFEAREYAEFTMEMFADDECGSRFWRDVLHAIDTVSFGPEGTNAASPAARGDHQECRSGRAAMAKLSKARRRGLWPERAPIGYGDRPRVEVTISMEEADYDRLAGFVHLTGYVWCVEDALNTAVSAMLGDEPVAHFADGIARQHGLRASELIFRADEPETSAVDRLYVAALFVAELSRWSMFTFVRDDNLPPPAVLALAQAALGEGRDLQGEIERARIDLGAVDAASDAQTGAEADAEMRSAGARSEKTAGNAGANNDLDDDIPF